MASMSRGSGAARQSRAHLGDLTAAYVDGQLGDLEMARARDHVDACADCAAAVAGQRLLKRRVRGLAGAPATPPESLLHRLALLGDELGSSPAPERRRSVTARLPAVSIAGALVALAAAGGVAWSGLGRGGGAPAVPAQATPASQSAPAPAYARPGEISLWTVMTTGGGRPGQPGSGG